MADLVPLTEHVSLLKLPNVTRTNIYVVHEDDGDVLVDPGPIGLAPLILSLDRRGVVRLRRVVLTHAHPAHAGSAARVTRGTGVAAWVSEAEAPFLDGRSAPLFPRGRRGRVIALLGRVVHLCPPLYRLERLSAGVSIGDLVPIATPGHSPGHMSFVHARDRVLLAGDAVVSDGGVLKLPDARRSQDPERARRSLAALVAADVDAVLPGHGRPLLSGGHAALAALAAATGATG